MFDGKLSITNDFDPLIRHWYEFHGRKVPSEALVEFLFEPCQNMKVDQVKAAVRNAMEDGAKLTDLSTYLKLERNKSGDREKREKRANTMFESWFDKLESTHGEDYARAMAARAYVETLNGKEFKANEWTYEPYLPAAPDPEKTITVAVQDGELQPVETVVVDSAAQEAAEAKKALQKKQALEKQKEVLQARKLLKDIDPIKPEETLVDDEMRELFGFDDDI